MTGSVTSVLDGTILLENAETNQMEPGRTDDAADWLLRALATDHD